MRTSGCIRHSKAPEINLNNLRHMGQAGAENEWMNEFRTHGKKKEEEAIKDGKRYLAFVRLFTQSEADKELACWRVLNQLLALHQSHWHHGGPQLTLPQRVRQTEVLRSAWYLGYEGKKNYQTGERWILSGKIRLVTVISVAVSFITKLLSEAQKSMFPVQLLTLYYA